MKIALLLQPLGPQDLTDWGSPQNIITGTSHTRGTLLHKGPDGQSPSVATGNPGYWRCQVARDEFCHFLEGEACYEHDNGESTEVRGNTVAFFPEGWTGACRVTKTVKKPYMIR